MAQPDAKIQYTVIAEGGKLFIHLENQCIQTSRKTVARHSKVISAMIEDELAKDRIDIEFQKDMCSLTGLIEIMRLVHSQNWNPYHIKTEHLIDCIKVAFKYDFSCLEFLAARLLPEKHLINCMSTLEMAATCKLKDLTRVCITEISKGNIAGDINLESLNIEQTRELAKASLTRLKKIYSLMSTLNECTWMPAPDVARLRLAVGISD
jgi:hypothetical protein